GDDAGARPLLGRVRPDRDRQRGELLRTGRQGIRVHRRHLRPAGGGRLDGEWIGAVDAAGGRTALLGADRTGATLSAAAGAGPGRCWDRGAGTGEVNGGATGLMDRMLLTLITFLPLVGMAVILCLPGRMHGLIRW